VHSIESVLQHYGYVGVFLSMVAEGCGAPLPAETILVTATAFASRGTLSIWGVGVAGAVGGIVGGTAGYFIGARGGLPLLRRYGSKVGIDEAKLARARAFFARRGLWAAFAGRFVAFLRLIIPMLAGVTGMSFRRFSAANAAGAIAAAALYAVLGYQFGRDLPALRRHLLLTSIAAIALLVIALGVAHARNRRRTTKRETRAST
jgi:membrane protein DedA with SNARE-associated domain